MCNKCTNGRRRVTTAVPLYTGTSAFFYIHYCVLGMNIKIFKQKTSLELDLESDKIYLT